MLIKQIDYLLWGTCSKAVKFKNSLCSSVIFDLQTGMKFLLTCGENG